MKNKIVALLNDQIDFLEKEQIEKLIEIPPKPELGDSMFSVSKTISQSTTDDCC